MAAYSLDDRKLRARLGVASPMEMLFLTCVVVSVAMAPIVIIEDHADFARIPQFTAGTWIGLGLLTFFHNYLSMILFLKALKVLDAIQAALSNYLIAFLAFRSPPSRWASA